MMRLVPHPVLLGSLIVMWLMLTRFSLGYLTLGTVLAVIASWAYNALHPVKPPIRRWRVILRLAATLIRDIIQSNIHITWLLLTERRGTRRSAFLQIPLEVRNENALALLAIILTATPGTAWLEYGSDSGILCLHIFDGGQADHYRRMIDQVYEPMLMEIFE